RTRWTQPDYFPAGYLLDAIGVAEQLARTTNSFEALNWSSDLESLNFSAASEYPLRRNLYTSAALKWLLGAATSWSGTRGTGYFLTTLKEILHASTGTIVGQPRGILRAHTPSVDRDALEAVLVAENKAGL
ncbi:hypothetical protein ACNQUF_12085, partial [Corynebacterium diphtheriae]